MSDNWFGGGSSGPAGGGKKPSAPAPPASAGSSGNNWFGGASSSSSAPAAPKKKSLLGQLKQVVTSVPSGLVGMTKQAGTQLKNEVKFQGPLAPIAFTVPGVAVAKHVIAPPKPRAGESTDEMNRRLFPLAQSTVESLKRTGSDVVHPTHFARASKEGTIVSKVLEDAANASIVLGPAAKGAGAIADHTAAAAAAEGAGRGAGLRAAVAHAGAQGIHGAAVGTQAVASAPFKPFELAATGLPAGRVLSHLPGVAVGDKVGLMPLAAKGFDRAAMSEGVTGQVARLAKVDPQSRLLRREALTPAMDAQSEAVGRQVALGRQVAGKLQSPAEEAAMLVVGEGQAPALAKLRAELPDRFDEFVAAHFGDTLSPEAAHLAADVASGKAPEAAARIDAALEVGRAGAGGRAERSAQYLAAKPSREWQTGYRADPGVIDKATEKAMAHLPKAEKLARTLRQRAEGARTTLEDFKANASAELNAKTEAARAAKLTDTQPGAGTGGAPAVREGGEAPPIDAMQGFFHNQGLPHVMAERAPGIHQFPLSGEHSNGQAFIYHAEDGKPAGYLVVNNPENLHLSDNELRARYDWQWALHKPKLLVNVDEAYRRRGIASQLYKTAEDSGIPIENISGHYGTLTPAAAAFRTGRLARLLPADASPRVPTVKPTYGMGKQLGRLDARASAAESVANRSEAVLGRMRERVRTTAAKAANSVEAAPARLRPVMTTNRQVTAELAGHATALRDQGLHEAAAKVTAAAAEIPTTLKALETAGVDPDHFIHMQGGDRPTFAGARSGGLPKVTKGREERFRADSVHFDRSVRAQTQGEIDTAKNVIARQTFDKVATMPFATKLGEGPLAGITTEADAVKAGYQPWNPKMLTEKGKVSVGEARTVAAGRAGTTVFVPDHIFNGFRSYFSSNAVDDILRKTYDPAIQGIKVAQLALSPSWQVNNIIGNAAMATFGAGLDPVTLAVGIKDAVKAYRASGPKGARNLEAVVPRRLLTAGPTHSEFAFLHAPEDQALGRFPRLQKAAHVAGAPARASYALNGFIDNIGRSAVYLAKKGQGLSDESAVRASLKAMGDFSRMRPAERTIVRRVIPYYAWSRHITQLAFSLPVEHPLRVAWTLHLADIYADPSTRDLPGSLAGAVKLPGGKLLSANRLFPFGDAGRPIEPAGLASQVSPILKMIGENTPVPLLGSQGVNSGTGKPYSRPPGTGRHDEFGNALPTAPSVAHQVGNLFPQKRLLDAATGHDKVARYDTGDKVMTKDGTIPTGKTGGLGALRFLGIPVSDRKQAESMAERVAKKQLANAKAKAGYEKKKAKR